MPEFFHCHAHGVTLPMSAYAEQRAHDAED